jgi:predicted phage terminase large subunit-like protein
MLLPHVFKRAWLHVVEEPPLPDYTSMTIQAWDTAIKTGAENDYSACSTVMLHDGHYYIIAAERMRLEFPDLVKFAKSQAQQYDPTRILVEDSGLGTPLVNELQRAGLPALAVKPQGNKIARMKAQTVKFEGGKVSFVRKALTPELQAEFLSVPNSRHDDLVDSICQALAASSDSTCAYDEITNRNYQNFYEALAFDAWIRQF